MRYEKDHKHASRMRIIESAGRRLKRDGIDGSGVATLMADAGLTNGAFYAHFESKDHLVAAVVADQLRVQRESLASLPAGREGIDSFLRWYLSLEHRSNPAEGCPSAALLDEIARGSDATRNAYTSGVLAMSDEVAARLSPGDPAAVRVAVLGVFALVIGAIQLARSLTDPNLARAVLDQSFKNAAELLDEAVPSPPASRKRKPVARRRTEAE
jgi:TetR/AcrR family transcriptional regulator, transcriptional repressor for nem operon